MEQVGYDAGIQTDSQYQETSLSLLILKFNTPPPPLPPFQTCFGENNVIFGVNKTGEKDETSHSTGERNIGQWRNGTHRWSRPAV